MQNLIGIDFSIVKTAACVLSDNKYSFYLWPKDLSIKDINILSNVKVNILSRENIENIDNVRYDIINANILSDLVIDSLLPFINKDTKIAFEGASFASKGNATISIMTWKYILIYKLSLLVPMDNIYTYYPLTVKSTAGCATKDKKGKNSMIKAFGESCSEHSLGLTIKNNPDILKKKVNYMTGIDDLADSYWVIQTLIKKESLIR